jgi:hypothetical protein
MESPLLSYEIGISIEGSQIMRVRRAAVIKHALALNKASLYPPDSSSDKNKALFYLGA